MQTNMQKRAKELLLEGKVQQVLAWKTSEYEWLPEPAFFTTVEDLNNLTYSKFCTANLSRYMRDVKEIKTLVFLRPCDSYSFNQLLTENQVKRENAYIIGIPCEGSVKVEEGEDTGLLESCTQCAKMTPIVYDEQFTDEVTRIQPDKNARFEIVEHFEEMSADERYAFWNVEFAKCIRCNACRNICPTCNCKKCVFDEEKYDTRQKANISQAEEQMFHVTRAFHVAGRCTDCGQCSRACPQQIPLHILNRKFIKDINGMYGEFQAGEDISTPSPLTSFNTDNDPEPRSSH